MHGIVLDVDRANGSVAVDAERPVRSSPSNSGGSSRWQVPSHHSKKPAMPTRRLVLVSIAAGACASFGAAAVSGCVGGLRYVARRSHPQDGGVAIPEHVLARLHGDDALVVHVEGAPLEVIVRRAGAQYIAIVPRCSHRGCALDVVPDGFDCPCHGATFDRLGRPLGGPANGPLPTLSTRLREGELWIELPA
ncbi:Phytoene desaturase [Minicystis rosea]|nr:Phytoene desaturase [Minicystis rosea]